MLKLTEVHITPREFDVLQLLGEGLSNKEIGARLGLEHRSVKGHLSRIAERVQLPKRCQGRVQRIALAISFARLCAKMPILRLPENQRKPV